MSMYTILLTAIMLLWTVTASAQEWTVVNKPSKNGAITFNVIASADSLHCLVAGFTSYNYPRVMLSENGGITWKWILAPELDFNKKEPVPFSAAYPSENLILLVCSRKSILRSEDKGNTWQTITIPDLPSDESIGKITMTDEQHGSIWYGGSLLYFTSDAGKSWQPQPFTHLDGSKFINDVMVFSPTDIYLFVTNAGTDSTWIYKSNNTGETWEVLEGPKGQGIRFVAASFPTSQHGWVIGDSLTGVGDLSADLVFHTANGGSSWERQLDTLIMSPDAPTAWGIRDVDFYDATQGFIVGHRGKILRTHDGGTTWYTQNSGLTLSSENNDPYDLGLLLAVKFISPTTAIACGWELTILRYNGSAITDVLPPYLTSAVSPESLSMYPNPTSSSLYVRYEQNNRPHNSVLFSVSDNLGRIIPVTVIEKTSSGMYEIIPSVQTGAGGTYILRIQDGQKIISSPFVIVR